MYIFCDLKRLFSHESWVLIYISLKFYGIKKRFAGPQAHRFPPYGGENGGVQRISETALPTGPWLKNVDPLTVNSAGQLSSLPLLGPPIKMGG
jgi:hypothetical protein